MIDIHAPEAVISAGCNSVIGNALQGLSQPVLQGRMQRHHRKDGAEHQDDVFRFRDALALAVGEHLGAPVAPHEEAANDDDQ